MKAIFSLPPKPHKPWKPITLDRPPMSMGYEGADCIDSALHLGFF